MNRVVATLPFAIAGACGGESGIRTGVDVDSLPVLSAVETLRIGSVDDPDYAFTLVGAVDVDAAGRIYVLDVFESEIRVFDSSGGFLTTFGRRGDGPGEFGTTPRMGVVGDTVWALELGSTRRITLFTPEGELLSTSGYIEGVPVTIGDSALTGVSTPDFMRADRTFQGNVSGSLTSSWGALECQAPEGPLAAPRIRFDLQGAVLDTSGWLMLDPPSAARPVRLLEARWPTRPAPPAAFNTQPVEVDEVLYYPPPPPDDSRVLIPLEAGYLVADPPSPDGRDQHQFTATRIGAGGDTLYHDVFTYQPEPYSDAALDEVAWACAKVPGGFIPFFNGVPMPRPAREDSADAFRAIRGTMALPELQPPVRGYWLGKDGALWLLRERSGGETSRWLVIAPEGTPRGHIELSSHLEIVWSRGDDLWAVERDEFGVPWLVRLRMG